MGTPIMQTRLEYYNSELEKKKLHDAANMLIPFTLRKEYPLPEIVMEGVVVNTDIFGTKMMARPVDFNDTDVRLFDPETGRATPWMNPKHVAELQLEWDYRYAKTPGV